MLPIKETAHKAMMTRRIGILVCLGLSLISTVTSFLSTFHAKNGVYRTGSISKSSCTMSMKQQQPSSLDDDLMKKVGKAALGSLLWLNVFAAIDGGQLPTANAMEYRLPPIDRKDPNRCVLQSSSIGQANAARDKLYDLRECDLKGQSGEGKDMSGLIGSEADFSGVNFKEAQISKAYARNSKFVNCDFTNAVVDRVSFDGSDMTGALFINTVLSGTTFADANLKNTDFSDAVSSIVITLSILLTKMYEFNY